MGSYRGNFFYLRRQAGYSSRMKQEKELAPMPMPNSLASQACRWRRTCPGCNWWGEATHIRKSNLLYSTYWFKYKFLWKTIFVATRLVLEEQLNTMVQPEWHIKFIITNTKVCSPSCQLLPYLLTLSSADLIHNNFSNICWVQWISIYIYLAIFIEPKMFIFNIKS